VIASVNCCLDRCVYPRISDVSRLLRACVAACCSRPLPQFGALGTADQSRAVGSQVARSTSGGDACARRVRALFDRLAPVRSTVAPKLSGLPPRALLRLGRLKIAQIKCTLLARDSGRASCLRSSPRAASGSYGGVVGFDPCYYRPPRRAKCCSARDHEVVQSQASTPLLKLLQGASRQAIVVQSSAIPPASPAPITALLPRIASLTCDFGPFHFASPAVGSKSGALRFRSLEFAFHASRRSDGQGMAHLDARFSIWSHPLLVKVCLFSTCIREPLCSLVQSSPGLVRKCRSTELVRWGGH